jgi:divalent metal cation (Fe/Co/Zn/Cd) transporter
MNVVEIGARTDTARWVRRVVGLAHVTIGYNLLEGVVSIGFGAADESLALFGFGIDSFIEVASALFVLWRFRDERALRPAAALVRERRAAFGIGLLFVALGVATIAGTGLRLWARQGPETAVPGLVISLVSLSFMFGLWRAKRRAGDALGSPTVRADAACSLACIQLSSVLLGGSLLVTLAPGLWWADAVAAAALAVLFGREGASGIRASRRPDFQGGCGCAGACATAHK